MSRLVMTTDALRELRVALLETPEESCAVLIATSVVVDGQLVRLCVREVVYPSSEDYLVRTTIEARLRPQFLAEITQRVRGSRESLVFVHSHPFALNSFSPTDDQGEMKLDEFLRARTPGTTHAAMLVTPEHTCARILGQKTPLRVIGVGARLMWASDSPESNTADSVYDRQVRAFGAHGQATLSRIRVGIVGLGGTGSLVVEQLSHLGIKNFFLIDPDKVEATNLNRLVGSTQKDLGRLKIEVARELVERINPSAKVEIRSESVLYSSTVKRLADVDWIFSCTDTQGSRSILNQFAYQFLIPVIDMGSVIVATEGHVSDIYGRTTMLVPGLGCLMCGPLLSPEKVRVDLLSEDERRRDPYVVGAKEPAPAVISLNATVSSMAVTMFLASAIGVPSEARSINYNAITGMTRAASITANPNCYVCSPRGFFARGDTFAAPGRMACEAVPTKNE